MLFLHISYAFAYAMLVAFMAAATTPSNFMVRPRDGPRFTHTDTLLAPRRDVSGSLIPREDRVFRNSTTLDTSWVDTPLFSYDHEVESGGTAVQLGVSITCNMCYIKGKATAQLTVKGDSNISQTIENYKTDVEQDVRNITSQAKDIVESYIGNVTEDLIHFSNFNIDELAFPTMPIDFNFGVPDLPTYDLRFQFDGMELYMDIETNISAAATYTLNLYSSNTPIGLSVSDDLQLGVILSVDLILGVEDAISINSGFHIKLEDGIAIDIPLFAQNVSSITFNGGHFEFLPVTVTSVGTVLKAVLRVGINAGLEMDLLDLGDLSFSAGAVVGVFANVAEFTTTVTETLGNHSSGCKVAIEEAYQFGLGAAAGASVAVGPHIWGPTYETETPLFYTTLTGACAVQGNPAATTTAPSAAMMARNILENTDLTPTTISTTTIYSIVGCQSPGLLNCPASLQSTSTVTSTVYLITSVPSGSDATFPATTQHAVTSVVDFGANAKTLPRATGKPTSYVPPPTATASTGTNSSSTGGGHTSHVSQHDIKIIIGVSVGVGVPVLTGLIVGLFFCLRRLKRQRLMTKMNTDSFGRGFHGKTGSF